MRESDVKIVAGFLHRAVQLALLLQKESGSKQLKDFVRVATVETQGSEGAAMVKQLRKEVEAFATKWPLPGVDVKNLRKPAGVDEHH
jgi:glycine hydroxymethyltransferase